MPMKRVCDRDSKGLCDEFPCLDDRCPFGEDRFYLTTHYTNGERDSIIKDDVWGVGSKPGEKGLWIEKRDGTVVVLHGQAAHRFIKWWFEVYVSKLDA